MTRTVCPELCTRLISDAKAREPMLAAFREFGDSYLIKTSHGAYGTRAVVQAMEGELALAEQLAAALEDIERLKSAQCQACGRANTPPDNGCRFVCEGCGSIGFQKGTQL